MNAGKLHHHSADLQIRALCRRSYGGFLRFSGCSCLKDFDVFGVSEIELISLTCQPASRPYGPREYAPGLRGPTKKNSSGGEREGVLGISKCIFTGYDS